MASPAHLSTKLRHLASHETGMALPTVLWMVVASFALVSAAMLSSVYAQRGSVRDEDSKAAIAAADAGANVALHRQNKLITEQGTAECLAAGSGGVLVPGGAAADGWCPEVSGTVGTASYVYRAKPVDDGVLEVVAIGTSQGVSRRVAVSSSATTVGSVLENEGVIGRDSLILEEESDVQTGAGTNGDVHVDNNANVCGNIRHGVGHGAFLTDNSTQCSGYDVIEDNITIPPPPVPADIGTNNSNFRLVKCVSTDNPTGCQLDPYNRSRSSTVPWDPDTRTLSTANNAVLTMGGMEAYWICKLILNNNSQLIMADGARVRIFFDTPENCGLSPGDEQIHVDNNATITATGYNPTIGNFDVPGFYLLGSPEIPTTAFWKNNSTSNQLILYGPNTDIDIRNNAHITGALVGKSVYLKNNVIVTQDAGFVPPTIGGAPIYQRERYTECAGSSTVGTFPSPPDANC